jgi:hypothetical protein
MTTLSKAVVVVPAVEAVTVTTFDLVDVQENYGYGEEGMGFGGGRGQRNSVNAQISFPTTPNPTFRNITVWEGDAYLAVRGTWTDATLKTRIAEILEAE